MRRRILAHWPLTTVTVVALLSLSLAAAAALANDGARDTRSVRGDITPFGLAPTETVRACIGGLPTNPGTDSLRWNVRFIAADGDVVAVEQLEVPHRGFRCTDLSYHDAVARLATRSALELTGRLQLAIEALPATSDWPALAPLLRGRQEVSNVGTVEIVAASGQTTVVVGRFGLKTYDVSRPTIP
jgi:hypothetical protein